MLYSNIEVKLAVTESRALVLVEVLQAVLVEVLQVAGQAPSMHTSRGGRASTLSVPLHVFALCTSSSGTYTAGGAGAGLAAAVGLGCPAQAGEMRGWLLARFFRHA